MSLLASLALTVFPFVLLAAIFGVLISKSRAAKAAGRPWSLGRTLAWVGLALLLMLLALWFVGSLIS